MKTKKIIYIIVSIAILIFADPVSADNNLPYAGEPSSFVISSLQEGQTTPITCTATLTDPDGCEEITGAAAVMFRSNIAGYTNCAANGRNCYRNISCSYNPSFDPCESGVGDLTVGYDCVANVQFYVDPTDAGQYEATDWSCEVTPADGGGPGSPAIFNAEMPSNIALDTDPLEIAYGTIPLGEISATAAVMSVINSGNRSLDIQLSGTDMICPAGTDIPVGNAQYNTFDFEYDVSGLTLTDTLATLTMELPQPSDSTPTVEADTFWELQMLATGVSGSCSGEVVFNALADD
ncbi:hypothetical protein KKC32_01080 [Patescibacteria group bacterium]|nr:hypothetical protein [Patescibacteria group bacterium]